FLEKEWLSEYLTENLPEKIQFNAQYDQRDPSKDQLINFNHIDRKLIRKFLTDLNYRKLDKRTIARRLSSLRSFFKYCQMQQIIEIDPTEELDTPKLDRSLPNSLSYDQICHFLSQPDETTYFGLRDRTMMELFYSSGLRISELIGLNKQDLDLKAFLVKLHGKGKKERIIPITKNAAKWLQTYLDHFERVENCDINKQNHPVFLNKYGTRITARSVNRLFEFYLKESGLSGKITPHTFRHTMATHLLENGMDLNSIRLILGHSALSTTTIYTEVSTKLKKKVYDETHPRA
ncbi:MAG: tyrosine recombinase XerC, partial [Parachlamydiaceae bacterium]|nr:tyrosine recombinase XerC [Parachlamydiaceae bacterium]